MLDTKADKLPPPPVAEPARRPVLSAYTLPAERYDEMFTAPGQPRPQWQALYEELRSTSAAELNKRIQSAERQIRDSGITYNVYTDPDGLDRFAACGRAEVGLSGRFAPVCVDVPR